MSVHYLYNERLRKWRSHGETVERLVQIDASCSREVMVNWHDSSSEIRD